MNSDDDARDWAGVVEAMRWALEKRRGHNDYWDWPTKSVKEAHIASEALQAAGYAIQSLMPCEKDPPDCEAQIDGLLVGIEVTELVDQKAIERFKRTKNSFQFSDWTEQTLESALSKRIRRKDVPEQVQEYRYDRYLLVIHCDEPELTAQRVEHYASRFSAVTKLIDEALLILSYDPKLGRCPLIRLNVKKLR